MQHTAHRVVPSDVRWMIFLVACASAPPPAPVEMAGHCVPPPKEEPKGNAHWVDRQDHGGTVSLDGDRGAAVEMAYEIMARHCGEGKFHVVEEGDEGMGPGTVPAIYDQAIEHTEYRIHYICL